MINYESNQVQWVYTAIMILYNSTPASYLHCRVVLDIHSLINKHSNMYFLNRSPRSSCSSYNLIICLNRIIITMCSPHLTVYSAERVNCCMIPHLMNFSDKKKKKNLSPRIIQPV